MEETGINEGIQDWIHKDKYGKEKWVKQKTVVNSGHQDDAIHSHGQTKERDYTTTSTIMTLKQGNSAFCYLFTVHSVLETCLCLSRARAGAHNISSLHQEERSFLSESNLNQFTPKGGTKQHHTK